MTDMTVSEFLFVIFIGSVSLATTAVFARTLTTATDSRCVRPFDIYFTFDHCPAWSRPMQCNEQYLWNIRIQQTSQTKLCLFLSILITVYCAFRISKSCCRLPHKYKWITEWLICTYLLSWKNWSHIIIIIKYICHFNALCTMLLVVHLLGLNTE